MDQDIRDSFSRVFDGLKSIGDTVTQTRLDLGERMTKVETCLNGHCNNGAIHVNQSTGKIENSNGENVAVRFKFPTKWLLVLFYIVVAVLSGAGLEDILKFIIR